VCAGNGVFKWLIGVVVAKTLPVGPRRGIAQVCGVRVAIAFPKPLSDGFIVINNHFPNTANMVGFNLELIGGKNKHFTAIFGVKPRGWYAPVSR